MQEPFPHDAASLTLIMQRYDAEHALLTSVLRQRKQRARFAAAVALAHDESAAEDEELVREAQAARSASEIARASSSFARMHHGPGLLDPPRWAPPGRQDCPDEPIDTPAYEYSPERPHGSPRYDRYDDDFYLWRQAHSRATPHLDAAVAAAPSFKWTPPVHGRGGITLPRVQLRRAGADAPVLHAQRALGRHAAARVSSSERADLRGPRAVRDGLRPRGTRL